MKTRKLWALVSIAAIAGLLIACTDTGRQTISKLVWDFGNWDQGEWQ